MRSACLALVVLLSSPTLAAAQAAPGALGAFPACEWRPTTLEPKTPEALFCPASDGHLRRVVFLDGFTRKTITAARAGDAAAIGLLGAAYLNAKRPAGDRPRGEALLRKALAMGDAAAARELGDLAYFRDDDQASAFRLYKTATEGGDIEAMRKLASSYEHGWGVKSNTATAIGWYEKAAAAGDTAAMMALSALAGYDTSPNHGEANKLKWLRAAAEAGDVQALGRLATYYDDRFGQVKDPVQAKLWRAKYDAAYMAQQFLYAEKFGLELDPQLDRGFGAGIGDIYFKGQHGVAKDVAVAISWYQRGADAGDEAAARSLEKIYRQGDGVPADTALADKWAIRIKEIERARLLAMAGEPLSSPADPNQLNAIKRLAMIDLTGVDPNGELTGDPKNVAAGAIWMRRAAEAGDAEAMDAMAKLYAAGIGVAKDEAEAKRWADKAAIADPNQFASIDGLIAAAPGDRAETILLLAVRLFREGRPDEGVFWYYVCQLRGRAYADVHTEDAGTFGDLFAVIGPQINQYAFGDIPKLIATIDRVLAWDEAHPDPNNPDSAARAKERKGLADLRTYILAHQADIRANRLKNGLTNSPP